MMSREECYRVLLSELGQCTHCACNVVCLVHRHQKSEDNRNVIKWNVRYVWACIENPNTNIQTRTGKQVRMDVGYSMRLAVKRDYVVFSRGSALKTRMNYDCFISCSCEVWILRCNCSYAVVLTTKIKHIQILADSFSKLSPRHPRPKITL